MSLTGLVRGRRSGFEAAQAVGDVGQGGDHDDLDVGARVRLEAPAYLEPVHARHHHIEEYDVGQLEMVLSAVGPLNAGMTWKYSLDSWFEQFDAGVQRRRPRARVRS